MRSGTRSAKLAEFLSTYAILHSIGVHPTTLIEKRDAGVGVGVYVRDACDAGTTLFVVPSHRVCATSVLSKVGTKSSFLNLASQESGSGSMCTSSPPPLTALEDGTALSAFDSGIITYLAGCERGSEWGEWCWRVALERHRSFSPLWGWVRSLPSPEDFRTSEEDVARQCRAQHSLCAPFLKRARSRMEEEKRGVYATLAKQRMAPCFANFSWAVEVLLSRGSLLPTCWPAARSPEKGVEEQEGAVRGGGSCGNIELGVVPFVDLINCDDGAGRATNARIEVAVDAEDLPQWYAQWLLDEAMTKGQCVGGPLDVGKSVLEQHGQQYCVCVTLTRDLTASEEVILDYVTPVVRTGVLTEVDDARVSRFLKYGF